MRKGTKPTYRPTNSTIQQGHYMTEQTMAFCQVLLKRSIVDSVFKDPYHLGWTALVKKHQQDHPNDPLPFPFNDPDPQIYTPLSESHPWHTQIHRDAFGYGEVASNIDQRLVVGSLREDMDIRYSIEGETHTDY